jgi:hypothetical protein
MGYLISRGHHGRDRMVDGFTTTYAISRSVVFSKSSTNKTDHHDITEILLKVALNTIKQTNKQTNKQTKKHYFFCLMVFKATFNNISVISWWSVLLVED